MLPEAEVSELFERWRPTTNLSAGSLRAYKKDVLRFVRQQLQGRGVCAASSEDAQAHLASVPDGDGRRRCLSALRGFYQFLNHEGLVGPEVVRALARGGAIVSLEDCFRSAGLDPASTALTFEDWFQAAITRDSFEIVLNSVTIVLPEVIWRRIAHVFRSKLAGVYNPTALQDLMQQSVMEALKATNASSPTKKL